MSILVGYLNISGIYTIIILPTNECNSIKFNCSDPFQQGLDAKPYEIYYALDALLDMMLGKKLFQDILTEVVHREQVS